MIQTNPAADDQVKITQLLEDPNNFLRKSLKEQEAAGQEVVDFHKVNISTLQTPILGGGNANIAFLGGNLSSVLLGGQDQNAHAVNMSATFWFERIRAKISVLGNKTSAQTFTPAGPTGPTFVVAPTTGLSNVQIPVTWTQIQYSQKVILNFGPLAWPHVSVATLAESTTFDVKLRAAA